MSAVKEMTSGKPYKLILAFALPMGNIFQQLYSMVDTVIVGKYVGVDALAGVGSTGAINFLVIGFALGICSGFSIKIAQSFGAGDYSGMRRYIANSFYLSGAAAVILTAGTMLLTKPILRLMDTPEDIFKDAYDYIIIIFAGISATIFYNILAGILRALGDSKTPLYFLIISSVINIGLDLLFIIVFNMGVKGAGWATVISQAVSAFFCLIYMKKRIWIIFYHFSRFLAIHNIIRQSSHFFCFFCYWTDCSKRSYDCQKNLPFNIILLLLLHFQCYINLVQVLFLFHLNYHIQ